MESTAHDLSSLPSSSLTLVAEVRQPCHAQGYSCISQLSGQQGIKLKFFAPCLSQSVNERDSDRQIDRQRDG